MGKYFKAIKNFMVSMFTQDEDIGLKSLEKKDEKSGIIYKLSGDFKFSEITKR